jgi:hypothetical protein
MAPSEKVRTYVRVPIPMGTPVAWEHAGRRRVSAVRVLAVGGLFVLAGDWLYRCGNTNASNMSARAL